MFAPCTMTAEGAYKTALSKDGKIISAVQKHTCTISLPTLAVTNFLRA